MKKSQKQIDSIRGAQVKDLSGDPLGLITYVLAPKSLNKFHPIRNQI
jgi:hypothetical protein